MKIGILGEKKSILAFRGLGINTFNVATKQDIINAKNKINEDNNYAIIFITEDIAEKYGEEIQEFYKKTLPAVLIAPGNKSLGIGKQELKKILERAIGNDSLIN